MIPSHIQRMALQLVDSDLATTREYWRAKFFGATPEQASDPRPFAVVMGITPEDRVQ